MSLLRSAEASFQTHDFPATLSHVRAAMERLAVDAGNGDVKRRYAALIDGRVDGARKRQDMNQHVLALNGFAHAGRHERVPPEPVTRADALFGLRVALSTIARLAG